jgi:hypothetical protein
MSGGVTYRGSCSPARCTPHNDSMISLGNQSRHPTPHVEWISLCVTCLWCMPHVAPLSIVSGCVRECLQRVRVRAGVRTFMHSFSQFHPAPFHSSSFALCRALFPFSHAHCIPSPPLPLSLHADVSAHVSQDPNSPTSRSQWSTTTLSLLSIPPNERIHTLFTQQCLPCNCLTFVFHGSINHCLWLTALVTPLRPPSRHHHPLPR